MLQTQKPTRKSRSIICGQERTVNQERRLKNQSYRGKRKVNNEWVYSIQRTSKAIKPKCDCAPSLRSKKSKVSDCFQRRTNILTFQYFWSNFATWNEKRKFITSNIERADPKM